MDAGTLIYLIAVIIYFIYTAVKKSNKKDNPDGLPGEVGRQDAERDSEPAQPARSFDELLKEIRREQQDRSRDLQNTGQQDTYKSPAPSKTEEKKYPSRWDEAPKEAPVYQQPSPNIPKAYQQYSGARASERNELKTLDEQVDIDKMGKLLGEVEKVADDKPVGNRYAALLKHPATLKDAVVVSEILQKKYF